MGALRTFIKKKTPFYFAVTQNIRIFAIDSDSPVSGLEGYLLERTFTDVVFCTQILAKFDSKQEETATGTSTYGCIMPFPPRSPWRKVNV